MKITDNRTKDKKEFLELFLVDEGFFLHVNGVPTVEFGHSSSWDGYILRVKPPFTVAQSSDIGILFDLPDRRLKYERPL